MSNSSKRYRLAFARIYLYDVYTHISRLQDHLPVARVHLAPLARVADVGVADQLQQKRSHLVRHYTRILTRDGATQEKDKKERVSRSDRVSRYFSTEAKDRGKLIRHYGLARVSVKKPR